MAALTYGGKKLPTTVNVNVTRSVFKATKPISVLNMRVVTLAQKTGFSWK